MLDKRKLLCFLSLLSILTGCYEVDYLTIDINEDFTSSVTFQIRPPFIPGKGSNEFAESDLNSLNSCGYEVESIDGKSINSGLRPSNSFNSILELNQTFDCLEKQGYGVQIFLKLQADVEETFLTKRYSIDIEIPDYASAKEIKESIANNKKISIPPHEKFRIFLPGKIKTEAGDSSLIVIEEDKSVGAVEWKLSAKEKSKDKESGFGEFWLVDKKINLKASSQIYKIDYKYIITTAIALIGLIFGTGLAKDRANSNR